MELKKINEGGMYIVRMLPEEVKALQLLVMGYAITLESAKARPTAEIGQIISQEEIRDALPSAFGFTAELETIERKADMIREFNNKLDEIRDTLPPFPLKYDLQLLQEAEEDTKYGIDRTVEEIIERIDNAQELEK